MIVVTDTWLAIVLCVVTMLGWGSWANTQKLAGKERWPFELYYWDYAIGVAVCGLLVALTAGSMGSHLVKVGANFEGARGGAIWTALASGALFNVANILLVVAIDRAGMAVAFPVGVGLALIIGTTANYAQAPKGGVAALVCGVGLIFLAMVASSIAHRRLPRTSTTSRTGVLYAVLAGLMMGFFYPQLMKSITPNFTEAKSTGGFLTPYSALLAFGFGLLASNLVFNTLFMRAGRVTYREYFSGSLRLHSLGILGGAIWMTALTSNVVASGSAGPAVSYALGQGATLVASLWGIFVWREFRQAPPGTNWWVSLMLIGYIAGLVIIGTAAI